MQVPNTDKSKRRDTDSLLPPLNDKIVLKNPPIVKT